MKKVFFFLVMMGLTVALNAQEELSWKQTLPRHDIQLGFGDPAIIFAASGKVDFTLPFWLNYRYTPPTTFSADDWFYNDVRRKTVAIPTINFEYRYRFAKWFWFGGAVSYTALFDRREDRITHELLSKTTDHYISIMPSVRFSWLNTKYITLYSGLSAGLIMGFSEAYEQVGSTLADRPYHYVTLDFAGQLTAVGIQGGKNWYGFAEVGFGVQGFVKAGFGYKFMKKEKKANNID